MFLAELIFFSELFLVMMGKLQSWKESQVQMFEDR